MNKIKIRHEETNLETEVVESSVPVWVSHGWTVVEDEGSQESAKDGEPVVVVADPKDAKSEQPKAPRTNGAPAAPDASKEE
jgi:hypothetical protein